MDMDSLSDALDEAAAAHRIANFTWEQHTVLGARLHLLGDGERWAVAGQLLVYWPENDGFQGTLWGATSEPAFHHRWLPLEPSRVVYDESMDPVGPEAFRLGDRVVPVDWDACRALEAEHGTSAELEALAGICRAHREGLLLDAETVSEHVHGLPTLAVVDDWTHPDLDRAERPSTIADWRTFARVLAEGVPATVTAEGAPNANDWRHWFRLGNR